MGNFSVLSEQWIPVRTIGGDREWASPTDILSLQGKYGAVDAPRPDLSGAITEFLIALNQTLLAPVHEDDWGDIVEDGPDANLVVTRLQEFQPAFWLFGEGNRFYQDQSSELTGTKRIQQLLFDQPGDQTLKHNKDHFAKRNEQMVASRAACIALLINRQFYDCGFGGGFRACLRGPGAMVSLITAGDLWDTIWLNTLPLRSFALGQEVSTDEMNTLFPWMSPTHTSEKGQPPILPDADFHPLTVFWGMAGRLRLTQDAGIEQKCSFFGEKAGVTSTVHAQRYGNNYEGNFRHPLSPVSDDGKGKRFFRRGRELSGSGGTYRSWRSLFTAHEAKRLPPEVFDHFVQYQRDKLFPDQQLNQWTFGYHFDKASALAFNQVTLPILPTHNYVELAQFGSDAVELSALFCGMLSFAIKKAFYGNYNENKKWDFPRTVDSRNSALFLQLDAEFWNATQTDFFALLEERRTTSVEGGQLLIKFAKGLHKQALRQFYELTDGPQFTSGKLKSTTRARTELEKAFIIRRKNIEQITNLQLKGNL